MYQQCGPVCPQTYDNQHCSAGCAEGCFCPDGMILSNNKCINLTDCQGTYILANILCNVNLNRSRAYINAWAQINARIQHCKENKNQCKMQTRCT